MRKAIISIWVIICCMCMGCKQQVSEHSGYPGAHRNFRVPHVGKTHGGGRYAVPPGGSSHGIALSQ